MMEQSNRPAALVFALLFFCLSALLLAQITSQTIWSDRVAFAAQPRVWPAVGLMMMVGFGAAHLWSTRGAGFSGTAVELWFWLRGFEYAGWFLGYVFLVPILGYLPASLLVAVVLALRLGFRGLAWISASLGLALCIVVLFRAVLRVHVPGGALYHRLPEPLSNFMLTWF